MSNLNAEQCGNRTDPLTRRSQRLPFFRILRKIPLATCTTNSSHVTHSTQQEP